MSSDLKIGVLLNFFFGFLFFFFHFFGLHWTKLRNGMLKIMGGFLKRRGKKEEKTQFLWKKEKKLKKKKARTGFEPAIFGFNNRRYHGNSVSSIRDRRLTTWPPSPVPFRRGKLEYLKLVPKMRGASSKRLPTSNQPIHQITTRSYSHCTLVELNRCHCTVKMHKRLKFSKTIDSNKSNVLSNPGFKRFGI